METYFYPSLSAKPWHLQHLLRALDLHLERVARPNRRRGAAQLLEVGAGAGLAEFLGQLAALTEQGAWAAAFDRRVVDVFGGTRDNFLETGCLTFVPDVKGGLASRKTVRYAASFLLRTA
ncbi:hypothetical protein PG993_003780 [Apiospora rasikravindrae]|uniref:Class I SAM-dependent methyltransferase n=1 Tax=Apiospora rasikravindrae TaxID=990691 RepID=A0ABR1U0H2_9PEZI